MKIYADSHGRGQPTRTAEEALPKLLADLDDGRGLFRQNGRFDYSAYETHPTALLVPAANHVLGIDGGKKRFLDLVVAITRAFALCWPSSGTSRFHRYNNGRGSRAPQPRGQRCARCSSNAPARGV